MERKLVALGILAVAGLCLSGCADSTAAPPAKEATAQEIESERFSDEDRAKMNELQNAAATPGGDR